MRDVARKAGCSQSTVSKALHNDPSIPEETRQRVREAVKVLGYRPNPLVSVLMSQLHSGRPRSKSPILVALKIRKGEKSRPDSPTTKAMLAGAAQRANELGYELENQQINLSTEDGGALLRQLRFRSVLGILILPLPWRLHHLPLDLSQFAAAALGRSLQTPSVPVYSPHHGANLVMLLDALFGKGFRRVGLAISPGMSEQVEDAWLGAYVRHLLRKSPGVLPPFIGDIASAEAVEAWLAKKRPDAIITKETWTLPKTLKQIGGKWTKLAVFTPARLGPSDVPGVEEHADRVGARAIEGIISQIHHNQVGVSTTPEVTFLKGTCSLDSLDLPPR